MEKNKVDGICLSDVPDVLIRPIGKQLSRMCKLTIDALTFSAIPKIRATIIPSGMATLCAAPFHCFVRCFQESVAVVRSTQTGSSSLFPDAFDNSADNLLLYGEVHLNSSIVLGNPLTTITQNKSYETRFIFPHEPICTTQD